MAPTRAETRRSISQRAWLGVWKTVHWVLVEWRQNKDAFNTIISYYEMRGLLHDKPKSMWRDVVKNSVPNCHLLGETAKDTIDRIWDFLAVTWIQDLPSTKQEGRALARGARSTTVSKYFATLTNFTSSPLKLEQWPFKYQTYISNV